MGGTFSLHFSSNWDFPRHFQLRDTTYKPRWSSRGSIREYLHVILSTGRILAGDAGFPSSILGGNMIFLGFKVL
jgi:hypothetical protein